MFYSDKPIQSMHEDQLGRNSFAKLLAQSLLHLNILDTFSIGLFGKWGSGKTSIVNMTLREIEEQQRDLCAEEKLIIVHFEPWNFSDENQLLNQFFIRMSNEFRNKGDKNLERIGNALEQYSDAFGLLGSLSPALGLLGFLGKRGTATLGKKLKNGVDEKDILKQKEFIIKLLEKQSNRILVVIDDIDRLSNTQIRQIFQLITSVAKFPNTMYLLVFDKDIVVKALENVQEGNGEDYLEKIIQMPIQIPDIPSTKIGQVLLHRLNEILAEHADVNFHEAHWQRLYEPCIASLVNNLRDINRLCNTVQFKLASISTEVDFTDLVAISALEIRFPQVFEWVKNNKSILTGGLYPGYLSEQKKSPKELYADYSSMFKLLLKEKNSQQFVDEQVEVVIEALSLLFPHFGLKIGNTYEVFAQNTLMDLQRLYKHLLECGRVECTESRNKPKGLSVKTVRNINQMISSALNCAVEQRLIPANPTKGCVLPKLERKEMKILPPESLGTFFEEARRSGVFELYYIDLATGLRRGELLGLKWSDIDLSKGIIHVRRQILRQNGKVVEAPLKTKNSYRNIAIGADAVNVLKGMEQKDEYVFPSPYGGPMSPDSVLHMLQRVLKRAGLERIRFHDLRHTFSVLALQNGVDVKTLSAMLGHYSAGFTLDTYAHVTTSMQKQAANAVGNFLSGTLQP